VGGSLSHLDPAAELVAVAAALDATVKVNGGKGERTIAFKDFPVAYMTPAIGADGFVTAVHFPAWAPGPRHAFEEFSRRHGDFAIVSAAALLELDGGGKIARASVTLGGVAVAPVRANDVEHALTGQNPGGELFRAACESCRTIEAIEDIHA